jgi:parvulin-like peptidyl-prolyl isomerase
MSRWNARQNLFIVIVAIAIGAGCSHDNSAVALKPSPVSTASFYRPIPGADDPHDSPVDRGGAIVAPVEAQAPVRHVTPAPAPKTEAAPAAPAVAEGTSPEPATGGTTAEYLTVGAVVIEVSGTPIYADKVLQTLTPALAAEAKLLNPDAFRAKAQADIVTKVNDLIQSEVVYAAAMQNLSKDEKDLARQLTEEWRKRQVSAAGGSEPQARAKALADGMTLDEKAQEQYRLYITQIWYSKKIMPRVEVTAEDMRRYYEAHREKEFSDTAKAQFRVIKITAASTGGLDQARAKITELHNQAVHQNDEEFAKMAGTTNDPALAHTQGRVGDALWKIQPGQVTDVIQVGDAFYIARLENRRDKRVRTFEDQDVQQEIYRILSQPQIAEQTARMRSKLLENAVFNPPLELNSVTAMEKLTQPVLEMAMQKYPQWAGK